MLYDDNGNEKDSWTMEDYWMRADGAWLFESKLNQFGEKVSSGPAIKGTVVVEPLNPQKQIALPEYKATLYSTNGNVLRTWQMQQYWHNEEYGYWTFDLDGTGANDAARCTKVTGNVVIESLSKSK